MRETVWGSWDSIPLSFVDFRNVPHSDTESKRNSLQSDSLFHVGEHLEAMGIVLLFREMVVEDLHCEAHERPKQTKHFELLLCPCWSCFSLTLITVLTVLQSEKETSHLQETNKQTDKQTNKQKNLFRVSCGTMQGTSVPL